MKKLLMVMLFMALCSVSSAGEFEIGCESILEGTIAASGSDTGDILKTRDINGYHGYFSIQPVFTGTGTLAISYQLSNNGTNWSPAVSITASATTDVVYPYPATGVNIFSGYQKLVFTETGTANEVVITGAYRCVQ